MTETVWRLYATDCESDWVAVASFPTLALAAKRIRELEVLPLAGHCLEVRIDADTSDDDALSLLLCAGLTTSYAIRREPA